MCTDPTEPFTKYKYEKPSIGVSELYKDPWSTYFEALKLLEVLSGRKHEHLFVKLSLQSSLAVWVELRQRRKFLQSCAQIVSLSTRIVRVKKGALLQKQK